MSWERFGTDRYQPDGEWVQTSLLVSVVGIQFRKPDVRKFAKAVRKAEKKKLEYGLELVLEPDNPADPNAIKVHGFAEVPRWFGQPQFKEWHVGYCGRELASELHRDLLSNNVDIAAELYRLFVKNDYYGIEFFVLAPPGHGFKRRKAQSQNLDS